MGGRRTGERARVERKGMAALENRDASRDGDSSRDANRAPYINTDSLGVSVTATRNSLYFIFR